MLYKERNTELSKLLKLNKTQSKLLQTNKQGSSHESWGVLTFTKQGQITYNMYFKVSFLKTHEDKVHSSGAYTLCTVGDSYLQFYLLTLTGQSADRS